MEAVNSHERLLDSREEADSERKTRSRMIIVSISLLLLLAVTAGFFAGPFAGRSSGSSLVSSSTAAVRSICGLTQYKDSCIASLSAAKSSNPEKIFRFSLSVARESLQKLTSFPVQYSNRNGGSSRMVREALRVCETVLNHAVETIDDTISAMNVKKGQSLFSNQRIDDLRTWLSTAITDQQTCLDALEEANATFLDEIKLLMKDAAEFTSNSLAIVSRSVEVHGEFDVPAKRQLLAAPDSSGFPSWVSAADRRLLLDAQPTPNVTVAQDGSGNVNTIAAALALIPLKSSSRFVIYVKAGVYLETVRLSNNQWNVMIYGDGSTATTISGSLNYVDGTPTFDSATVAATGQGFMARDIGIKNTAGAVKHQAVAFRSGADQSVYYQCLFDGFQDTLYTHSNRQFYRDCTVTGTIDFIFGNSAVVFQNCNILPRQPMAKQYNTITAQGKTDPNQNTGISIQRCVINALDALTLPTYLGRPWKDYSTTVVMQTNIGGFLSPLGWSPWLPGVTPPSTIFYGEYQNTGPGADTAGRVNWSGYYKSLTPAQEAQFNVANFIQGTNWLPATGVAFDAV